VILNATEGPIQKYMGIFDKLFKGKDKLPLQNEPQADGKHGEEWDFYFTNVDDAFGSIYVDLGLSKIAPLKDKPNIVLVSVKMKNPNEDGLSSSEEYDILFSIEDILVSFVVEKNNAVYAGRLTSKGNMDFYFFVEDVTYCCKTISEAMVTFPDYEYSFDTSEDPEWSNYFNFLYPLPYQYQSIKNRRVIGSLAKRGDSLSKERRVDHWIFFKDAIGRDNFLAKIKDDGFAIESNDYNAQFGALPFRLRISRTDKVDHNSVDNYVSQLWKLADECSGEYDGWETSVEND
jgi:uncharacterized protein (TIGR01619 family)